MADEKLLDPEALSLTPITWGDGNKLIFSRGGQMTWRAATEKDLEAAGFVRASRLAAVESDARRMHYLGNLVRSRSSEEQEELNALMRKYPPLASKEGSAATEEPKSQPHPQGARLGGPADKLRADIAVALRDLATMADADTAPRHIAWQKLANELERLGKNT